ncbi:TPA: putative sulfate exporter family transporter, partial [bacterium]|nr:putative sulfate exporter family transporter [bacterium]
FFVLLALIRTTGDYLVINKEIFWNIDAWKDMQNFIKTWSEYFLVIAMAGAGLSIDIKKFGQLGYKPFLAGLISAVTVGFVSFILIKVFIANL